MQVTKYNRKAVDDSAKCPILRKGFGGPTPTNCNDVKAHLCFVAMLRGFVQKGTLLSHGPYSKEHLGKPLVTVLSVRIAQKCTFLRQG